MFTITIDPNIYRRRQPSRLTPVLKIHIIIIVNTNATYHNAFGMQLLVCNMQLRRRDMFDVWSLQKCVFAGGDSHTPFYMLCKQFDVQIFREAVSILWRNNCRWERLSCQWGRVLNIRVFLFKIKSDTVISRPLITFDYILI